MRKYGHWKLEVRLSWLLFMLAWSDVVFASLWFLQSIRVARQGRVQEVQEAYEKLHPGKGAEFAATLI